MSATITRRAAIVGTSLAALRARAEAWPARPLRLVLPYAPGGQSDTVARLLQPRMAAFLGQPIVIENRSGAGGSIGAGIVAAAAPDGYTLLFDAASFLIVPFAVKGLGFDHATAFAPIGLVVEQPYVLAVATRFPPRDLAAFVAAGKTQEINYGSPGVGSVGHLAGALFASRAGIRMEHVPYRGGAEAARDLAAGSIEAGIMSTNSLAPLFEAGRAHPIAITSLERRGGPPGVPTIAESGYPGFEMASWNGYFAPAGTPAPVIARIAEAINHASADAAVQTALHKIGSVPVQADPAGFAERLARERETIGRVIRETGVTFG